MTSLYGTLISDDNFHLKSEILMREYQLDINILKNKYEIDSGLIMFESVYTEAETTPEETAKNKKESKGFFEFIGDLIKRFIKLLADFAVMVKEAVLGPSKNLTPEEYFEDPSVQVKLNHDIEELHRVAEEETLKGRKIVQAISKGTHIDDHVIADWIDTSSRRMKNVKPLAVAVGVLFGKRFVYNKFFGKKTEEMKELEKLSKDKTLDKKQRDQCKKTLNHMIMIGQYELNAEKEYYKSLHGFAKVKYKAGKIFNNVTSTKKHFDKYTK